MAPGLSDSQLYFVCVELVTPAGLTPFLMVSKSAATSGQTVFKELHSHSLCPTQQGHPLDLMPIRLFGEACQLCTLPPLMPYECPADQHACMSPSQYHRADTCADDMCRHSWLLKSNDPPLPDKQTAACVLLCTHGAPFRNFRA